MKKKGTKETNQKVKERQSKRWRLRPVLESWLKVDLYRGGVGEGGGWWLAAASRGFCIQCRRLHVLKVHLKVPLETSGVSFI